MREIKFKAFDDVLLKMFGPLTLKEIADNNFGITNWNQIKLMQYTGLKDKNGKDIYEYNELDGAYEVIFKDLKYSLRHISNNDIIGLQDYWRDKNGEIEVTREYTKV